MSKQMKVVVTMESYSSFNKEDILAHRKEGWAVVSSDHSSILWGKDFEYKVFTQTEMEDLISVFLELDSTCLIQVLSKDLSVKWQYKFNDKKIEEIPQLF